MFDVKLKKFSAAGYGGKVGEFVSLTVCYRMRDLDSRAPISPSRKIIECLGFLRRVEW